MEDNLRPRTLRMTSYALILWLYLRSGSALTTALLSVSFYAPYVIMSIFAGTLSDRWNKKRTMLVCDLLAALSTVIVFLLIKEYTSRYAGACLLLPQHLTIFYHTYRFSNGWPVCR